MTEFYQRITEFLKEYLEIPDDFFRPDGILKPVAAALCLRYLMQNEVFKDWQELQQEAYKEYGVMIPKTAMEGFQ